MTSGQTLVDCVDVGPVTVYFPVPSLPSFWLSHDLAALFGMEYNHDAEKKLRKHLTDRPKGRLSIDHEADEVGVRASNAELMSYVLRVLDALCVAEMRLGGEAIERARALMNAAPKRKKQKWTLGSVFEISLPDKSVGFGQVVFVNQSKRGISEALYDCRSSARIERYTEERLMDIVTSRTVTIDHGFCGRIEDGILRVIGEAPVLVNPHSGPRGPFGTVYSGGVSMMAHLWFGFIPWFPASQWDRELLRGVTRPPTAWLLSKEQEEEYRAATTKERQVLEDRWGRERVVRKDA